MALIYTICFCRRGDAILMLYRNKPPNARQWNGLGGKIELGETPPACVRREVAEVAGIDLCFARRVRFAGLVTWASGVDPTARKGNLAGVGPQVLTPDSEDQSGLGAIGDRYEHRSLDFRAGAELGQVALEWRLDRRRLQRGPKLFGKGHDDSSGKKTPLLHTPWGVSPPASASSASS